MMTGGSRTGRRAPGLPPIETVELFPVLGAKLMELLRGLASAEWQLPTACAGWSVKDVAAHLLDTALRRLSIDRDQHLPPGAPGSASELVGFINGMNREWVAAARRLSPRVLADWLEAVERDLYRHFHAADPQAPARFSVSWAGEQSSAAWFDIAREYTERWHHQQQIREATGRPGIETRALLFPVLDTFMRALPFVYRDVRAESGAAIGIRVAGEAGGEWQLVRQEAGWELSYGMPSAPAATLQVPQEFAWKLGTKGATAQQARERSRISGRAELADAFFAMLCIVG